MIKAKKIHKDYINFGKTFLYAKKLRLVNDQILICIKKLDFDSNKELEKSSLDLKEHIEDWISTWDKEQFIRKPMPGARLSLRATTFLRNWQRHCSQSHTLPSGSL